MGFDRFSLTRIPKRCMIMKEVINMRCLNDLIFSPQLNIPKCKVEGMNIEESMVMETTYHEGMWMEHLSQKAWQR